MSRPAMPWSEMSKIRMILISKIHQLFIHCISTRYAHNMTKMIASNWVVTLNGVRNKYVQNQTVDKSESAQNYYATLIRSNASLLSTNRSNMCYVTEYSMRSCVL